MSVKDIEKFGKPKPVREEFKRAAPLPIQSDILVGDLPRDVSQSGSPLVFDVTRYLSYVEDADVSEAQAKELLESLWAIVVGFVDLGFGVSPIQQAMDKSHVVEGSASPVVVSSSERQSDTKKSERRDAARPLVPGMGEW